MTLTTNEAQKLIAKVLGDKFSDAEVIISDAPANMMDDYQMAKAFEDFGHAYRDDKKLHCLKAVRELMGSTLKQSKDVCELIDKFRPENSR